MKWQDLLGFFLFLFLRLTEAITCYECTSSQGVDCKRSSVSCRYGFFGCVKIGVFNGGVDRMGNFYDEEHHITMMIRGCALLPMGGVDLCEQTSIFGYRVQKCTCFNDYCNSSRTRNLSIFIILLLLFGYLLR